MAEYIRRLVSGDKARFKDKILNLELDLVYLTDQIIIMGYPAGGIEGWYRNRRDDAKKFLEHRHGKNYWVFNFCPIRENSYDPSFFDGRVSRYPFPDHHAPPLPMMPLVAREMRAWLQGSPDRVAVIHCKAGKGRSGTMACTYLLSLDDDPSPPKLGRSYTSNEWAKIRADSAMDVVPSDVDDDTKQVTNSGSSTPLEDVPERTESPGPASPTSNTSVFPDSLTAILDLHTSRRMKAPSSLGKKLKQGVSIPSQRRWLYYWALILAHAAPPHLWPATEESQVQRPKVRLTQVKLRMREASGAKVGLVRAANAVLERTRGVKNATATGDSHVWVSLARYDDEFVEVLEKWERHTRDERHMGRRRPGSEHMGEEEVGRIFAGGKWDREKMVRSFARMGAVGEGTIVKEDVEGEKDKKLEIYTLRPLTNQKWDTFREGLQHETGAKLDLDEAKVPASEKNSMYDLTQSVKEHGVVLDAGREVRVKLYMGQVFMGWLWFIPTFHMSPASSGPTTFRLTRKELDFPLGLGSGIVDVEIQMEWVGTADAEVVQPPARMESKEEAPEAEGVGAVAAALTPGVGVKEAVEVAQAAQD
ncbi:hypothetical protein FPV67DRAFT_1669665 [Lyophyllum atratum]|nr:hypothetical protein FPV67DRAFT_1669665 [Lyophyllum atratum]